MKLSCARGSETHVRGSAWKRLRKQMLIVRSRKGRGSRFIHDELVVAEAPRKQNQFTTHPRKLKLWSRKQRGRARGRQVGLEENYIGVFATAQLFMLCGSTLTVNFTLGLHSVCVLHSVYGLFYYAAIFCFVGRPAAQASAKHISRASTRSWVVFSMMWRRFPRSRSPAPLPARVYLGMITNPLVAASFICQ